MHLIPLCYIDPRSHLLPFQVSFSESLCEKSSLLR
jgi:hypothetical protein